MQHNIEISVIITTYRRSARILRRAINSVIMQKYKDWELIIINDNFENNFKEEVRNLISEEYNNVNNKIRYVENKKNLGACKSRNIGIEQSEGNFIAFLDDDDEWLPHKIDLLLPLFSDPCLGLVYCDFHIFRENSKIRRKKIEHFEGQVFYKLLENNFIGGCSVPIMRKNIVVECGMFDVELPSSQDIDLWLRIACKYDVKYLDIPLVNYYVMDNSITRNVEKQLGGWYLIMKKYELIFADSSYLRSIYINRIVEALFANRKIHQSLSLYYKEYKHSIILLIKFSPIIFKGLIKIMIIPIRGY